MVFVADCNTFRLFDEENVILLTFTAMKKRAIHKHLLSPDLFVMGHYSKRH